MYQSAGKIMHKMDCILSVIGTDWAKPSLPLYLNCLLIPVLADCVYELIKIKA